MHIPDGFLEEVSRTLNDNEIYCHVSADPDRLFIVMDDWSVTLEVTDVDVVA